MSEKVNIFYGVSIGHCQKRSVFLVVIVSVTVRKGQYF